MFFHLVGFSLPVHAVLASSRASFFVLWLLALWHRRLENASWRIWGMQRSRRHSRLQLLPDGTVDEIHGDPDEGDNSFRRRATTGSGSSSGARSRPSRGPSGPGSSSSALPSGGGVVPPTGGVLSPDNLTPDGIVLDGKSNGAAGGRGDDDDDDDLNDLVVPRPVSQSWVDAQAAEEAERAAALRQRRSQRQQQSLDRLVALSEGTAGPTEGKRGGGGGDGAAPEWLRPSADASHDKVGSGAGAVRGGLGEPPVKRPGTMPGGEINWDELDASPVGKNTKLLEVRLRGEGQQAWHWWKGAAAGALATHVLGEGEASSRGAWRVGGASTDAWLFVVDAFLCGLACIVIVAVYPSFPTKARETIASLRSG